MRFSLEAFNSEIKLWKRMDVGKANGINKSCNRYTLREDFMLEWQLSIVAELNKKQKKTATQERLETKRYMFF